MTVDLPETPNRREDPSTALDVLRRSLYFVGALVLSNAASSGCSDDNSTPDALTTAGSSAAGSAGAATQPPAAGSTAGAVTSGAGAIAASAGRSGSPSAPGSSATGGAGASAAAGASGAAGAGGVAGSTASAGTPAAGNGASAGNSAGGTGGAAGAAMPATCEKGTVKASEVVFIGESFIAQTGAIPRLTTKLARDAGTIGPSESYRSTAVSGTQLTTGAIPMQFTTAKNAGPVKVVLMDGGGNDLLLGTDRCKGTYDARCKQVVDVVHELFTKMKTDGVKDVVYFFYPDPMGVGANIKPAMDILRPEMRKECEGSTDVRCIWVDQRESWEGKYSTFTSDGIHPTEAGSMASAKQIWDAMVANCVAQ